MASTEYLTKDGDRWDLIAFRAYGDPFNVQPLIDANPGQALTPVFAGGVRLLVPIVETQNSTTVANELLPPWKRA